MGKRKRRIFSARFKAEVVLEVLSGRKAQAEICREHQLSPALLASWRAIFLERIELVFDADHPRSSELERIAELEQLAGRQALEIEILKKTSRLLGRPPSSNSKLS